MIPTIRRQAILDLLEGHDMLILPDLVRRMGISESTLRRDLKALEECGRVELLRGGGIRMRKEAAELHIETKLKLNRAGKELIARAAAKLVGPGDVVFMDPSSANYMLIDFIEAEDVTVISNSVLHIGRLLEAGIPCVLIGGQIKASTRASFGPIAEQVMRGLRFTKAFLGANGISAAAGLTNHDPHEQAIKRLAMDLSVQSYFLVDQSKHGVVTLCKVADVEACTVIMDQVPPALSGYANVVAARALMDGPKNAAALSTLA